MSWAPEHQARLKRYDLWPRVAGEEIVDEAVQSIAIPIDAEENFWREFSARRGLRNGVNGGPLAAEDWREIARRQLRVEIFKEREWKDALPSYFLKRKTALDQVVYSLLRVRSLAEAKEALNQIESGDKTLGDLAAIHSCGPERHTSGLLGPSPLGTLHPELAQILSSMAPGDLRGPAKVAEWVVLVRLEKRLAARLGDAAVRAQLLSELFNQWLQDKMRRHSGEKDTASPTIGLETSDVEDSPAEAEPAEIAIPSPTPGADSFIPAKGELDCALASLEMACTKLEIPFRPAVLRRVLVRQLERTAGRPLSLRSLGAAAESAGLLAQWITLSPAELLQVEPPVLLRRGGHLSLLVEAGSKEFVLHSPATGVQRITPGANEPAEEALLLQAGRRETGEPFSLRWFWPAIRRHRRVLLEVLVASFFVQLFALANPLLTQVIIDKVLVQDSAGTLHVLGLLLAVTILFGSVLGGLRTYLFADATNRIDLTLGSAVMDRLYRLGLGYFQKRPVGELAGRVNELENIRQFLTGSALTLVLDAAFSVIYVAVMLAYSVPLTLVALGAVPLLVGLTIVVSPMLRRQLRQRAECYAETQSHLIETLGGIQTIKAQSLEPLARWRWQERYARYVSAGFRSVVVSTGLNTASGFLNRMADLAVLWIGAWMVLDHKLSIGQLIAFRIISGYVSAPLLRLAGSWQQFQETGMSLERLSDILDAPREQGESGEKNIPLPPVEGKVVYESLGFSYGGPGAPPQLRGVSFAAEPGAFVGVAGQSGSGKSTLLKLLPILHTPLEGRILIDGYDVTKVELQSLRKQIGVVLQDTLLFDGTVQENIALSEPEATAEEIVAAARLACAHDFIMRLPDGYNTHLGEGGRGLSHGQRQRVVLARMVLTKPRLLILDEATSALDSPTEQEVLQNLSRAFQGRTIFMVTHRLRSLRHADLILYLDGGALTESGTHKQLMDLDGSYAALARQQEALE